MFGFFNKGNSAYEKLAYEFKFNGIEGNLINLKDYENKVIVVVNVASRCGFTNQYEDLLNSDSNYHQQVIVNALDENVLESITDQLLIDGIKLFEEAFDSLLDEIKNKAKKI